MDTFLPMSYYKTPHRVRALLLLATPPSSFASLPTESFLINDILFDFCEGWTYAHWKMIYLLRHLVWPPTVVPTPQMLGIFLHELFYFNGENPARPYHFVFAGSSVLWCLDPRAPEDMNWTPKDLDVWYQECPCWSCRRTRIYDMEPNGEWFMGCMENFHKRCSNLAIPRTSVTVGRQDVRADGAIKKEWVSPYYVNSPCDPKWDYPVMGSEEFRLRSKTCQVAHRMKVLAGGTIFDLASPILESGIPMQMIYPATWRLDNERCYRLEPISTWVFYSITSGFDLTCVRCAFDPVSNQFFTSVPDPWVPRPFEEQDHSSTVKTPEEVVRHTLRVEKYLERGYILPFDKNARKRERS